ncbi:putative calcium binding protein [Plasmopara halstedii]
MLRSPASVKKNDKQKMLQKRIALSASISADALLYQEDQLHARRCPVGNSTTDLSPVANEKIATSVLPTSSAELGPLSIPRQRDQAKITSFSPKKLPLSVSTSQSLENYAERLEQAENTELFTYTSALCYRVTGRYLPRALLQSDPKAQEREIERIQRDPEILRAIDSVRALSAQFKDVAQTTMGHRKELGHRLFRIEESYLKLFEKLLELSLRLYWDYESRTEAQRKEDRASILCWRDKYERKCQELVKESNKLAARDIIHRAREIELQDLQGQMRDIKSDVKDQRELEAQISQLKNDMLTQRMLEQKLRDENDQVTNARDEIVEYQKQSQKDLQMKHKLLIQDLRRDIREKDAFISKQIGELRLLKEIVPVPPVFYESHSSQTEVDDDGLWNVQDGIPCFVSKSVMHRSMWRRFSAFVACKNCKGRPLPKAARMSTYKRDLQDVDREDLDLLFADFGKKRTEKATRRLERIEQEWELPRHTVLFLSNLPKSVVAFPLYSAEHVISQIEAIYDDKFISDRIDEADGVAREDLPRFTCEYFLKTHGLRQSAEVGLYRFLISVKNLFQHNSHVRLFARLSNLLKVDQDEIAESLPTSLDKKKVANFLRVFLEARHYLLRSPARKPRIDKTSLEEERFVVEHVVQVEPTKQWVPLNHAIAVLRWYSSCLPEASISHYCRQVEYITAIYDGHTLKEITGNRLAVRAEMRRVMLANENLKESFSSNKIGNCQQRPSPPQIVADVHKVLCLLMDALEQRHKVIKKDLTRLFDAADVNHDRVLTLDEFSAIIRKGKPHFSDRRILRMFRESLMGGADQSFALSMEAFVGVCNDHGLVSLLPDGRLVDPFVSR